MQLEVDNNRQIILSEISEILILKTQKGNTLQICMSDDTVQIKVAGSDKWYKVNEDTGVIEQL